MKLENKNISQLKITLRKVLHPYIIKRDHGICFTCGGYGREAGHFIPAPIEELRFDERNIHAQCTYCNCMLEGNRAVYRQKMELLYGGKLVREFWAKYKKGGSYKHNKEELIRKIIYYRQRKKEFEK